MLLPFKLGFGSKLGAANQYMSWIHIDDHIKAIQYIIEKKSITGAVNMVAPTAVTNAEFSHALAAAFNKKVYLSTPAFILKLVMGERACLLLDSQKVTPNKLLQSGFKFNFDNITAAFKNLI